ncbi:MAG: hypothetical protein ABIJ34_05235 [archaeon]
MDSFHAYLKKQLLEYVESEKKKGIPLEQIEETLLSAGHQKNIVDEVVAELRKEETTGKKTDHKDPVESDLVGQLKNSFKMFMANSSGKEVKEAQKDFSTTDTEQVVEDVINEAEVIEEKTMLESMLFFIYLFVIGLAILFSAGGSDSPLANVALGFLPGILSVFISFLMLNLADNVPLYVFIPLVISGIFYALGRFLPFQIFASMDMEPLAIVNFLIGFAFNVLVVYVRFVKPKHMRRKFIRREQALPRVTKAQHIKTRMEIEELKREFKL